MKPELNIVASDEDFTFYTGLHRAGHAVHFPFACLSVRWLHQRKKRIGGKIIIDSGAFMELHIDGEYRTPVEKHAATLYRLHTDGVVDIAVAVAQDYMCEPFMLAKTGLTILDHQRLTVERYDALIAELRRLFAGAIPFPVMPVLQGFEIEDYLHHIEMYGERLTPGMWVGVGSVCKRQGNVGVIERLLTAIKEVRPDLRLHGFWGEADRAAKQGGASAVAQRRQHGLVVRSAEAKARSRRQPLGGSHEIHHADCRASRE